MGANGQRGQHEPLCCARSVQAGASRAGGKLRAGHHVAPRRAAPGHRRPAASCRPAIAPRHVALRWALGGCLMAVGAWWWLCWLCWPLSCVVWPSRAEPLEPAAVRETIERETSVIMEIGPRAQRAAGAVIVVSSLSSMVLVARWCAVSCGLHRALAGPPYRCARVCRRVVPCREPCWCQSCAACAVCAGILCCASCAESC